VSVPQIAAAADTGARLQVLVVSSQFPFPPRWGFAVRVCQLVRQLAERHDVTLLTYGSQEDRQWIDELRRVVSVEVVERERRAVADKRRMQVLTVPSRRPFACSAVHSPEMQTAIDELCRRRRFDVIQLESSVLCVFRFPSDAAIVLDEHNIEYEVFQRMHAGERSLARRSFNKREFRRFRRFEQRWWRHVDGCTVTSDREALIVREHAPETPVAVVQNGVDLEYFQPASSGGEPDRALFNGLLDYRPNLDAAYHLVEDIWPLVRQRRPGARLTIVGRGNRADLRRLSRDGVDVVGEVPDIRPFLREAAVVAAPVRIGGGTRFKVIEALAAGKAIVSTSLGCEGVGVRAGEHLAVADTADAFAAAVTTLFEHPPLAQAMGAAGRTLAESEYSWDLAGSKLDALYRRVARRDTVDRQLHAPAIAFAAAG
jgi:polysaccharide biosynthesis protein PslH